MLVSKPAWILGLHEVSASDRDELASFSHHVAPFVEQLKRVKPCAEAQRQDQ